MLTGSSDRGVQWVCVQMTLSENWIPPTKNIISLSVYHHLPHLMAIIWGIYTYIYIHTYITLHTYIHIYIMFRQSQANAVTIGRELPSSCKPLWRRSQTANGKAQALRVCSGKLSTSSEHCHLSQWNIVRNMSIESMDWFKGKFTESPIFNGKIYGFL